MMDEAGITHAEAKSSTLTRREVARVLGVHQDSVSRLLGEGLAGAVLKWGGQGRNMVFSRALVLRWLYARDCRRGASGGRCWLCRSVLEDCQVVGEHLQASHHGVFERCEDPECGAQAGFGLPCGLSSLDLARELRRNSRERS